MYLAHFGLQQTPFNVTADPEFFFLTRQHQDALSHLLYGIRERKGFIALTGDIGTGKTTLCKVFLRQLDDSIKTAFVPNPTLSELQLLQAIVEDFGLIPQQKNKLALVNQLNRFLLDQMTIGRNTVVIIDEAQSLSIRLLEQMRQLSNLETDKAKLLQLILVGQPQLRDKLSAPELQQLRQRIAVRYHINPLDDREVPQYMAHRLQVAGYQGDPLFDEGALAEITQYSRGTPRLINLLCDKALLACYALQTRQATREVIRRSIEELEGRIAV